MNLYFDNAATSWPKAPGVAESIARCIQTGMGNPGRTPNPLQNRIVFDVRESLAYLIHAPDSSRIAFGLNATHMINIGIQGILQSGDHVVTTSMEHNAVARPLRYLERNRGISLEIVPCSPEGYFDTRQIQTAITKKTRLVVVNHSSNVTGAVNDLESLGKIVRDSNAVFMVDCAQTAGTVGIDVERDRIDLLAGPGHKSLLGPAGVGFLYVSSRCRPAPLIFGGTGSFSERDDQPEVLPDCYESGTMNIHGLAGFLAALRFIRHTGLDAIQEKKIRVNARMIDGLAAIPGIRLVGPDKTDNRTMVFSIQVPGKELADVADELFSGHGIITRTGLHCAPWAHRTAGSYPEGTIRFSPGIFHNDADIDAMLEAIDRSVRNAR